MRLQTSWKIIDGNPITAGIYLGDLVIGKVIRVVCPDTGAICFELRTLCEVRQFSELPDAMRAMGIEGAWESRHVALTERS